MSVIIPIQKASKKTWIILTVLLTLCGWYVVAAQPFKVRDPADPRFDPAKFRFEDYPGIPPMEDALRKLFPVGTPKEFVEKVLVKAGEAQTYQRGEPQFSKQFHYIYKPFSISVPPRVWNVTATYNEHNLLTSMQINGRLTTGE